MADASLLAAASAALLRKAGGALGIVLIAALAGCTRGDAPSSGAPSSPSAPHSGAPGSQRAPQNGQPLAGTPTPDGKRPTWAELTPAQRQALAPLASEWNKMPPQRKKKWLEIAARYSQMPPAEQQRLQNRMREWAQLTPEQRRLARDSFARAKKLDAGQKSAKWEHYQSLPAEEKQKLAAKAETKKNVTNLPRPQSSRSPARTVNPAMPEAQTAPVNTASMPTLTTSAPATTIAPAPATGSSNEIMIGDPLSTPVR